MLRDEDLQALVEIHLDEGKGLGDISKEVRAETGCGLREAIDATLSGLRLAHRAGHPLAKDVFNTWNERYGRSAPLV